MPNVQYMKAHLLTASDSVQLSPEAINFDKHLKAQFGAKASSVVRRMRHSRWGQGRGSPGVMGAGSLRETGGEGAGGISNRGGSREK